jgi:hypothetical protein
VFKVRDCEQSRTLKTLTLLSSSTTKEKPAQVKRGDVSGVVRGGGVMEAAGPRAGAVGRGAAAVRQREVALLPPWQSP